VADIIVFICLALLDLLYVSLIRLSGMN
jgi:hypothetical protein